MEDLRLHSLRQDPSPEFAKRLREELRSHERVMPTDARRWPVMKIAASIAVVAAAAGLLSVPAVRASAQSFLSLFRVVNFVAVPVDESRLHALESRDLDPGHLIGEQTQVLLDPGPPTAVLSTAQASAAAGFDVKVPSYDFGATVTEISVKGEQAARITADARRLEQVMNALGINDLSVPDGIDGKTATVHVPPVVMMKYEEGPRVTRFRQSRTPQVSMPEGMNLPALGEIGLRVLGLPASEAKQFADAIDWQTTVLVPLPASASAFKEVDINGHRGMAIDRWVPNRTAEKRQLMHMLLWSADGRVYAIEGTQAAPQILLMAQSVK